jgi:glycosyltransferase involved in cell wall biosynthesis
LLSVVVPAYNEASRILDTLEQVAGFLSTRPYAWEVVVVDDGSGDDTPVLVAGFAARHPQVRLLERPHRGKGAAVRVGMLAAAGQYRFMCDADLSMPIQQVERFLPPQMVGADVVVGSREAVGSRRVGEPWRRHLMGRFYNFLVRLLAVPGLQDTQCGFKCFRGEMAPDLFGRQTLDGFAFDVEVLFLARQAGLRIREVGIDWHYRQQSRVHPLRDSLAMTRDLLKIRWRSLTGRYGRRGR